MYNKINSGEGIKKKFVIHNDSIKYKNNSYAVHFFMKKKTLVFVQILGNSNRKNLAAMHVWEGEIDRNIHAHA